MPGYEHSTSEITEVTREGDRIIIKGTLCFTYEASAGETTARDAYLATMAERRWKLGLRLPRGQRLEGLAFAGRAGEVVMRPDDGVTHELEEAFPCPADEIWIGLVPSPGERRYTWQGSTLLTICYSFTLIISGLRCLPEAIVIVLTYFNERFSSHYLAHALLVTEFPGARTRVAAIVDVAKRRLGRPRPWDGPAAAKTPSGKASKPVRAAAAKKAPAPKARAKAGKQRKR